MDTIILQNPIDMHIHLRQDSMLEAVLPYSVRHFSTLLAMPNLNPPLMDAESSTYLHNEIMRLVKKDSQNCGLNGEHFIPIIALYIHDNLTLDMLKEAHLAGVQDSKTLLQGIYKC